MRGIELGTFSQNPRARRNSQFQARLVERVVGIRLWFPAERVKVASPLSWLCVDRPSAESVPEMRGGSGDVVITQR